MNKELQLDTVATAQEPFSAILAMIRTIPEGMRPAGLLEHGKTEIVGAGRKMVCRPGKILVRHRDLHKGEFDS